MKFLGYPPYLAYVLSGKRSRVMQRIRDCDSARFDAIRRDNDFRILPNFPEMLQVEDFHKTATFFCGKLDQFSWEFVDIFQSGDFYYDWILRLGIYLGDFVIQHSLQEAAWVKDKNGLWVVQINRKSGPFLWNPFTIVERRYFFGEPAELNIVLDIFKKVEC